MGTHSNPVQFGLATVSPQQTKAIPASNDQLSINRKTTTKTNEKKFLGLSGKALGLGAGAITIAALAVAAIINHGRGGKAAAKGGRQALDTTIGQADTTAPSAGHAFSSPPAHPQPPGTRPASERPSNLGNPLSADDTKLSDDMRIGFDLENPPTILLKDFKQNVLNDISNTHLPAELREALIEKFQSAQTVGEFFEASDNIETLANLYNHFEGYLPDKLKPIVDKLIKAETEEEYDRTKILAEVLVNIYNQSGKRDVNALFEDYNRLAPISDVKDFCNTHNNLAPELRQAVAWKNKIPDSLRRPVRLNALTLNNRS